MPHELGRQQLLSEIIKQLYYRKDGHWEWLGRWEARFIVIKGKREFERLAPLVHYTVEVRGRLMEKNSALVREYLYQELTGSILAPKRVKVTCGRENCVNPHHMEVVV